MVNLFLYYASLQLQTSEQISCIIDTPREVARNGYERREEFYGILHHENVSGYASSIADEKYQTRSAQQE
jgi:hypothetical protein